MATFLLLPKVDGLISLHWVAVGETARWECLDDDNADTSYVQCDNGLATMVIEYANPSVAEGDIVSIDSVRFISSGRSEARGVASNVIIRFEAPTAGFAETCSFDPHFSNYETINGTARTTHDGTHAWTYANLEALEMKCTKSLNTGVRLSYLALEVTYTATVAADNATFFGANF